MAVVNGLCIVDGLSKIQGIFVGERADFGCLFAVAGLPSSSDLVHSQSSIQHVGWRVSCEFFELDWNMDSQELIQV